MTPRPSVLAEERAYREAFEAACRALGGRPASDVGCFWIETRAGEVHAKCNPEMRAIFCRFLSPEKAVLALGDVRRVVTGVNAHTGLWVHGGAAGAVDVWKRKIAELRIGMVRS